MVIDQVRDGMRSTLNGKNISTVIVAVGSMFSCSVHIATTKVVIVDEYIIYEKDSLVYVSHNNKDTPLKNLAMACAFIASETRITISNNKK